MHGLYEFWINGRLGSDEKLKSGFTGYQSRIQYQTYDILDFLTEGQKVILQITSVYRKNVGHDTG